LRPTILPTGYSTFPTLLPSQRPTQFPSNRAANTTEAAIVSQNGTLPAAGFTWWILLIILLLLCCLLLLMWFLCRKNSKNKKAIAAEESTSNVADRVPTITLELSKGGEYLGRSPADQPAKEARKSLHSADISDSSTSPKKDAAAHAFALASPPRSSRTATALQKGTSNAVVLPSEALSASNVVSKLSKASGLSGGMNEATISSEMLEPPSIDTSKGANTNDSRVSINEPQAQAKSETTNAASVRSHVPVPLLRARDNVLPLQIFFASPSDDKNAVPSAVPNSGILFVAPSL
jgi:hypothetical protein